MAILSPQNLNTWSPTSAPSTPADRGAVFDPSERPRRPPAAVHDDCEPSPSDHTRPPRSCASSSAPAGQQGQRHRLDAGPKGGRHLGSDARRRRHVAYLHTPRAPPDPHRCADHPPNLTPKSSSHRGAEGEKATAAVLLQFFTQRPDHALLAPMIGPTFTLHDTRGLRPPPGADPGDGPQTRRHRRRHLVAPNFAFDPPARGLPKGRAAAGPVNSGRPQRLRADLGGHRAPVQRGLRPLRLPGKAIKLSYVLAEATLFDTTTPPAEEPKIIYVDAMR